MPARELRVLKLGGSVLGSPAEVRTALGVVQKELAHGDVALVVSAMGRTTRDLDLAGKKRRLRIYQGRMSSRVRW